MRPFIREVGYTNRVFEKIFGEDISWTRYCLLTQREREVMKHVVEGLLNKQIAAKLGTSEFTIKIHRKAVMQKMKAGSVPELVRLSQKCGCHL
jgi:FixJ family two-component response regulator